MTRALPLALLALGFAWLAANVSALVMWVITGVAVVALIALMLAMYWKDMFVGPGTLADDVRLVGRKLVKDRGGEAERLRREREEVGFDDDDVVGTVSRREDD